MYPDSLYNFVGLKGLSWLGVAICYALFDYIFNMIMCYITGGIQRCREIFTDRKQRGKKRSKNAREVLHNLNVGGSKRVSDFRADRLSWIWPITVLAIPIALLGITRETMTSTISSINSLGINFEGYRIIPINYMQYIIWGFALVFSASTTYRYARLRSEPTWFSKSLFYELLRQLLFDTPIAYAVASIAVWWLDFATALYRLLGDNKIQFPTLSPDLMYGLSPAHNTIIWLSFGLIVISLLPTVMIGREPGQKYSVMYKLGLYSGLVVIFALNGLLIYRFGQRLDSIQKDALHAIINITSNDPLMNIGNNSSLSVYLQYYQIVTTLPDNFQIPTWLNLSYSVRMLIFAYEILSSTSIDKKKLLSKIVDLIK